MSWTDTLNIYGIATLPTPVQDSSLQTATTYSTASIPATALSGTFINSLKIGNAQDADSAVYIDTQGIYAGSSVFASAPFSVDLQGNLVANSVIITGYIPTGGAAADVNSHVVTVNGGQITANTITASQIAANTITATQIASATITTTQIAASTITGSNIAAGTITATNISVSNLSAISANLGTITAGTINGTTITGATIQTAASGQRVTLNNAGNSSLAFYDSTGTLSGIVFAAAGAFFFTGSNDVLISGGTAEGAIALTTSGDVSLQGKAATNNININCSILHTSSAGFSFPAGGDLDLNGAGGTNTVATNCNFKANGNIDATGTVSAHIKAFDIEHPSKEGWRLKYICIEAPEALVFARGTADTEDDIVFPQHFIDISEEGSIECQIGKLKGSEKISWFATGVRKGYNNFEPEYKVV